MAADQMNGGPAAGARSRRAALEYVGVRDKPMIKTVEAVIDERGNVRLLEPVHPGGVRRGLVTILEERPTERPNETALLSEGALAEDWDRPEEDEAWKHLQEVQ